VNLAVFHVNLAYFHVKLRVFHVKERRFRANLRRSCGFLCSRFVGFIVFENKKLQDAFRIECVSVSR